MRLITFLHSGRQGIGTLNRKSGVITDFSVADPTFPATMTELICLDSAGLTQALAVVQSALPEAHIPSSDVKILAPIPTPQCNIMCVGRNYHEHAKESHDSGFDATACKMAVPDDPIIFTKAPSSVIGPGAAIPSYLGPTESVNYEGELAIVISGEGRGITKEDAFDYVYGYTVINDVTARTLQHKQWFIGKSLDGFCPMGRSS